MRVLITGGAGFIGYHTAAKLLDQDHEVTILDNFNNFYDPQIKRRNVGDLQKLGPAHVFEGDILDTQSLRSVFEDRRPEAIVHLAAWAGVRPSLEKPDIYSAVNITGTVNLLELAREYGTECFIFGSSSSVYGGSPRVPFREDDPVDKPVSPYAATKRAGELICHTYSHNYSMNITCLRFFTVYGPRQRPEMAIHKFARLITEGKELPLYGNGESRRDYTYIDDIVQGVVAALRVNPGYDIINLGESQTVTLLDLVSRLESALGKKARVNFLPEQPGDMPITYADITRAQKVLGYHPETDLDVGIRSFVAWFTGNRWTRAVS
jgi:UDP-glucuronate 4-epimerase